MTWSGIGRSSPGSASAGNNSLEERLAAPRSVCGGGLSVVSRHPPGRISGACQLRTDASAARSKSEREEQFYVRPDFGVGPHWGIRQVPDLHHRQAGPTGRRRRDGAGGRNHCPRDRGGGTAHPGGDRLLPPHRRCGGADVRRREDPRFVLPPGGAAHRAGDPGLPPDRPSPAPVLPEGLSQRDADRRHRARRRPAEPPRRPGHQRRLGGADDLRHPVRRPGRGGPPRPSRRRLDPAPHLPGG